MALLSWLSQSNPKLGDVSFPEPEPPTNVEHSMTDMDVDITKPKTETPTSELVRGIKIAVELPQISLERKKEFVSVEDLDDYDANEVSLFNFLNIPGSYRFDVEVWPGSAGIEAS